MKSTGTIAPNFHEGTRSEYLAQYVFSGFGTSIPVPHPEDSGIDLYCTLGERIGQRLHVRNYYFVQVKSNKNDIVYEGAKSVEWLLSHNYPFIVCVIDKKNSMVEIYQTLILSTCYYQEDIQNRVSDYLFTRGIFLSYCIYQVKFMFEAFRNPFQEHLLF